MRHPFIKIAVALVLLAVLVRGAVPFPLGFWKPASTSSVAQDTRDDFESYSNLASVSGLNGGTGWNAAYVDRNNPLGVQSLDDLESYSNGADLTSLLNAGAGWNGGYVGSIVDTPVASPISGAPTQSVTLTSSSGATIYYTTNGTTPTTGSTLYTGAISVTVDTAIKTFAVKTGYRDSLVETFLYDTPPSNTVAYWQLWQHSGDTISPVVGSANVTNRGGLFSNGGLTFNGSSTYADTTSFAIGGNNVSMVVWMKYSGSGGFLLAQEPINTGFMLYCSTSPGLGTRGGGAPYTSLDVTVPSANVWHQIIATLAGGTANLYVDGSLVGGPTSVVAYSDASRVMSVGRYNSASYFPGTIALVQVCNGILSATEVTNVWNAQRAAFGL